MPTIGGVTCDLIQGVYQNNTQRVVMEIRPGFNGFAAQLTGRGDTSVDYRLVWYNTHSAILAFEALVFALKGTVVTITDDWGNVLTSVLITEVGPMQKSPALGAPGSNRGEMQIKGYFR